MIIGAFIPNTKIGFLGLQGLVAFGLVVVGIVFAMIMAFIFKRTLMKGAKSTLLIELPSYKMPVFKDYLLGLWDRAKIFINRAGRIILPASIIIWFLASYPSKEDGIAGTFAGMIGGVIEPIPTALAFLAWFVFAPQCLSTLAIMKKETNGWKWPLFAFGYLFVLAYAAAGLTYHTARAFGL